MKKLIAATLACLLAATAYADVEITGTKFPEADQLGGQSLKLNGAGVRVKFIVDVYTAGLYLPRKEKSAAAILAQSGPKTVHIVMLRDVSGADFAEATEKGFKANHAAAELQKHQPKLDELLAAMRGFGEVKKGSSIRIELLPTGVRILVNGQLKGDIAAGEAFGQALLRNWLGDKPVDSDLKDAMLGA